MNALRRSIALRLLGIFALLSQLLLADLHVQQPTRNAGFPSLYSFCGSSTAVFERLRAVAPPELWQRLQQDRQRHSKCSHKLCAGMHGAHLAGSPGVFTPLIAWLRDIWRPESRKLSPRWRIADFAFARGPPHAFVD